MVSKGSMFGVVSAKCGGYKQAQNSYGQITFPGDLVPCGRTAYRRMKVIDRVLWMCKDCERRYKGVSCG